MHILGREIKEYFGVHIDMHSLRKLLQICTYPFSRKSSSEITIPLHPQAEADYTD